MAYEIFDHPRFYRKEITAGTTHQIEAIRSNSISVGVAPGSGGSMLVEYSLSPKECPENEKIWREWEWNTTSVNVDDLLLGAIGELRVTAYDANGILEVVFNRV